MSKLERKMSKIERRVLNDGERLIPGRSHDRAELIRHRSSYWLFRKVIECDLLSGQGANRAFRILDLGCGVGHGSQLLSEIPGVQVVGIDNSKDAIAYANVNYSRYNVSYEVADANTYIPSMPGFDYVVSRHMLEHVPNGLVLGLKANWRNRLIINVPYKEKPGNRHHAITQIDKSMFPADNEVEFFFEDLSGCTSVSSDTENLNSIVFCKRRKGFPAIADILEFPVDAWRPNPVEELGLRPLARYQSRYTMPRLLNYLKRRLTR